MQIDDNINPKSYFHIINALMLEKQEEGSGSDNFKPDAYVFGDLFSALLGFPNTDECRKDTAKATCFSGAPVKDVDDTDTVRLPCSYCQSLFNKSASCGGILSNVTEAELLSKIDALQNHTFEKVRNMLYSIYISV